MNCCPFLYLFTAKSGCSSPRVVPVNIRRVTLALVESPRWPYRWNRRRMSLQSGNWLRALELSNDPKRGWQNSNKNRVHLFICNPSNLDKRRKKERKKKKRYILGIYWPRPGSTKLAKKMVHLCWYSFRSGSNRQSGFCQRKGACVRWKDIPGKPGRELA